YRYDLAPYTRQLVSQLDKGRALFTQPPMPIKCAGAPQKAMYLACSAWEGRRVLGDLDVQFHNAGAALFGVADYVPALMETVDRYGIGLNFESNLVAVDGPGRQATFRQAGGEVTLDFDMLHVCPPQKGNAVVADSDLADPAGYVEVDQFSLQHTRFANVFGLGDGCSSGNAKTAAAVRQQAPVVAENLLAVIDGAPLQAGYDGYGSCPLTVERGKIVLAEFTYGGKLAPTFPSWLIDGTRPSRLSWFLKEKLLPPVYWHLMLKGHEVLAGAKPLADLRKTAG
ncbi:MAG: FAD/NAD(P)-binding oxidoreductase, partial [Novosphingobium sp.]